MRKSSTGCDSTPTRGATQTDTCGAMWGVRHAPARARWLYRWSAAARRGRAARPATGPPRSAALRPARAPHAPAQAQAPRARDGRARLSCGSARHAGPPSHPCARPPPHQAATGPPPGRHRAGPLGGAHLLAHAQVLEPLACDLAHAQLVDELRRQYGHGARPEDPLDLRAVALCAARAERELVREDAHTLHGPVPPLVAALGGGRDRAQDGARAQRHRALQREADVVGVDARLGVAHHGGGELLERLHRLRLGLAPAD
eukprot:scaffold39422_cov65-Phaeocystis_antarctica.AAC.1